MFTECPECSIGFRVTAKVLQQAGGRVRCGGCGHAFSALENLTEELPSADLQEENSAAETATEDLTSDEKFRETSRQLLKTLNELAGPEEVRIEDTGFEWQVLDEDEAAAAAADAPTDVAATEDAPVSLELVHDEDPSDALHYDKRSESDDEAEDEDQIATATDIEGIEEEGIAAEAEIEQREKDVATEAPPTEEEWSDLLEVVTEDGADGDDIPLEVEEELAAIHSELSTKDDPGPADLDSQFDMQAEAMGLEISGSHEVAEDEPGVDDVVEETAAAEADVAEEAVATEVDVAEDGSAELDKLSEEDALIAAAYAPAEDSAEEGIAAEAEIDQREKDVAAEAAPTEAAPTEAEIDQDEEDVAAAADDKEEIAAAFTPDAEAIELSIEESADAPQEAPEYTPADEVPEQSEEEMTINQQIDQELLATAVQDENLSATIIGLENAEKMFEEEAAGVETIIMEGDVVRGAMEREAEKEKRERALKRFDKAGNLIDSYMARRAVRGGRRSTDPAGYSVIGIAAGLVLMLAVQVVHANRQSLSTSQWFNQTIGQVYRILGDPVTPEWSIKGWQFEATNGSVADDQDVLTIYSRIGNKSEQPLPYPLVHVSLTDRWEEIIGSRVLEPNEYLAADLNPSQPVTAGANFTAVITIDEPSVNATGFKLNVCYRDSPGRVRCATEDFKD
jgi:predicted Zn finger-like uncharacterized protein